MYTYLEAMGWAAGRMLSVKEGVCLVGGAVMLAARGVAMKGKGAEVESEGLCWVTGAAEVLVAPEVV